MRDESDFEFLVTLVVQILMVSFPWLWKSAISAVIKSFRVTEGVQLKSGPDLRNVRFIANARERTKLETLACYSGYDIRYVSRPCLP